MSQSVAKRSEGSASQFITSCIVLQYCKYLTQVIVSKRAYAVLHRRRSALCHAMSYHTMWYAMMIIISCRHCRRGRSFEGPSWSWSTGHYSRVRMVISDRAK